ncbi:polyserase-2-like isoform X2 [Uranotaenia lowii]|uniref:polyserase-2-like isoform X2 n=1 Tax=Uranotaenia lowii TaxID=190385 RepID=UPI00247B0AD5|nr:polyserase-2-like isoform X2 [Uranotaenia lowii]
MRIVSVLATALFWFQVNCSDDDEFTGNNALYRCGIQKRFGEQLIHHGWSAELGQWPWHVALYQEESGNFSYKCGGTLIDQRHILTAAHCVVQKNGLPFEGDKLMVELGKHDLYDYPDQVQVRNVSEVHVHPEYSPNRHDIAVLVLEKIVRYSDFVVPICMEDVRRGLRDDLIGERGWVAGWGLDEHGSVSMKLKTARMPVVSYTECIESDPTLFGRFISEAVYCASDRNSTSVCLGDSGGGMYFSTGDHYELRGIVSFSGKTLTGGCNVDKYVAFTNIAYYYPWISSLTRDEIEHYDNLPKRISEQKCKEFAQLARKRNNGVCYNARSPHSVAIVNGSILICSGVLISEFFVMTSYNFCLKNYDKIANLFIRIAYDLDLEVKAIYRHPDSESTPGVDLGLIELTDRVKLERQLIPACLANEGTENLYDNLLRTGFSGKRVYEFFESSENRLMPLKECKDYMSKTSSTEVASNQICIQLQETSSEEDDTPSHNQGIVGSGLQTFNSRSCMSTVVGVTSRMQQGDLSVALYTRVASTLGWIENIVWGGGRDLEAVATTQMPVWFTFYFRLVTNNETGELEARLFNAETGKDA